MAIRVPQKGLLLIFMIVLSSQGCIKTATPSITPVTIRTVPPTASARADIPVTESFMEISGIDDWSPTEPTVPTMTSTPVPVGTYTLFFYPPLAIKYDPSLWDAGLHSLVLPGCTLGEQGPTDFNGPHTSEIVLLGKVKYEVLSFPEKSEAVNKAYIADQEFATGTGLPVFWVIAEPEAWNACKLLAEKVLTTLYFP